MKRFSEQLHKKANRITLRADEKRELRKRLVAYMEYHPLPQERRSTPRAALSTEPYELVALPFQHIWRGVAGVFVVVLVLVPILAERSVPGDTLYAVKVQFNEELRSTLTFDSYQKVEWETQRLNRRLAEARLLASEGRLTEEVEAQVAEAVRTHSENAQREIEALRNVDADGAAIASIELGTTLAVQSESLKQQDTQTSPAATPDTDATGTSMTTVDEFDSAMASDSPTDLIASAIDESRAAAEASRGTSTPPAYEKLIAKVEQNTTRIYELRDSIKEVAPDRKRADVQRRIEDLERAMAAAIEVRAQDELAARQQLVDVLERSQKLIVYMTEIEVVETVDIDRLVPIVLTPEEETAITANLTSEITTQRARIAELLPEVTDEGVADKATYALDLMDENIAAIASTTSFAAFEPLAKDTLAIGEDTINALERSLAPATATPTPNEPAATGTPATTTPVAVPPIATPPTSTPATTTPETATSVPVSGDVVTPESTEADSSTDSIDSSQ